MFEHKGYKGRIHSADMDNGWFSGIIEGIQDMVTFEGKTVPQLQKAFQDSVEDYLEFCENRKELPEKPFSGKFVVRLAPDLHQQASDAAREEDVSLNTWIVSAVEMRLKQPSSISGSLSFDEMNHLASCVAALLAEKKRAPASPTKERAKTSSRRVQNEPGKRLIGT